MRISVIIPTLNAGRHIEKLLSMLAAQDIKPFEVIIIDSSSEDNTVEIAVRLGARTMLIPRHAFDHGRTRNAAAKEAQGEVLVFMTQDALPLDNSLLGRLAAALSKPDVAAAYGRHIPAADASPAEVFARGFNYPAVSLIKGRDDIPAYGIKTFFFSNVCSAVRKDVFVESGMFPEGVRLNEDMLLAARLILSGHKVAYVHDAVVIHSHNYSLLRQFMRYYNIGSSLRHNRWVLAYAGAEGEGIKFIREQVRFVLAQNKYRLIPYIFLEYLAKYAGYRLGLVSG